MSGGNVLATTAPAAEEVINLGQYFQVISNAKWRILLLATLCACLAAIVVSKIPLTYQATATLLIEAQQSKAVSFEEIYVLDSNRKEYYATQFKILGSNSIAEQVVQRLKLKHHPDFAKKPSLFNRLKAAMSLYRQQIKPVRLPESHGELSAVELQFLVSQFKQRLLISPIRDTQLVNITFESSDANLAALVANTLAEVYIEQHMNSKMGITQKAADWLTTRLVDLQGQLDISESKLQAYREQENLIDVKGVVGLVANELEQTAAQLVIARNDKNKLENIVRVINEYGRSNMMMLGSIAEITSHKVIQDVKQAVVKAEQKVSELAGVYGPKHPLMIAARAELASVKSNLSQQIKRLITGIDKKLATSKQNINSLEGELTSIRARYQALTRKENEYRQLMREVQTNRQLYDTFLSRSKETEVTRDFYSAVARITDKATAPNGPAKPRKNLIVMLAFIAAIGFGVMLALIQGALDDTVKSAADVTDKLKQHILGLLPLVVKEKSLPLYHFFNKDGRKFAESIRTLRTNFYLTDSANPKKVIQVTSSVPSEGKRTTATNLAFALGQMEKTLLIDADLRRPSIYKKFGIAAEHPGLVNLITGTAKFKDCIYQDERSGISVMPCGVIPANPLELLASPRFIKLLEVLKLKYDRIIIDTAPVQAVSDALMIAQYADAVVYVVRSDYTRMSVIQGAIARLLKVNAKLAGIVLNHVDTKKVSKADNYLGYQGLYDAQGYSEHKRAS
ncbi:GumC family protein [Thalassomonas haliotis]|uniref:non-specific protein-tyrosine kinase n=1 Tax=Thalassomonas haliotis TaxID=485448 RepID=A0ABY7VID9_9GAMM|nr:polysaccharide biosynthesis tyrosine autokinase [Thalassomonas haliotis]WDE12790.1 polysaccharide biosynthesis tyrosine autokinase [Thalassomonas haliotis]